MYKRARLAGVPLKLEEAPAEAVTHFKVAPGLIADFNAYTAYINQRIGNDWHHTGDIIAHHYHAMLEWRFYLLTRGDHRVFLRQVEASVQRRYEGFRPAGSVYDGMGRAMEPNVQFSLSGYAGQMTSRLSCYQQAGGSQHELDTGIRRFLTEMERFLLPRLDRTVRLPEDDAREARVTYRYFESDARPDRATVTMLDRYVHDSCGGYLDSAYLIGKVFGRGYHIYLRPRYIFAGNDDQRLEVVMQPLRRRMPVVPAVV